MPKVDVQTQIVIDRPLGIVSAYSADPDHVCTWYKNIKSVEWKTSKPLKEGSQLAFIAQFLGRRLEYTYEIVKFVPDSILIMRTADGPFPMETTYKWFSISKSQTKMILRNKGDAKGFAAITAPIMSAMMRKANTKDLALLKSVLESKKA